MESGVETMERIAGLLFSAAVVRLAGAALAVYLGLTIGGEVIDSLAAVSAALEVTSQGN